ncbi:hypothetical protein ACQZV8_02085 [Magnetococcales bacterium HHB-1]
MHIQYMDHYHKDQLQREWDAFDLDMNPFLGLLSMVFVPIFSLAAILYFVSLWF